MRGRMHRSFAYGIPYLLGAIFACIAGILMCLRVRASSPALINTSYLWQSLFIAAFVAVTRASDRAAVPIALASALTYVILSNALTLIGASSFLSHALTIAVGIIVYILAICVTRRKDMVYYFKSWKKQ